jgi:hypothetical protein
MTVSMNGAEQLSAADRKLLTPQAIERWTQGLSPDDYTPEDIVRLEKQRQKSLRTLRQGVQLQEQEWRLLRYLSSESGKIRTYLEIARHMWSTTKNPVTAAMLRSRNGYSSPMVGAIHVLVHGIRYKLEIDPLRSQHLATVRGVGYVWYEAPPSANDGIDYARRTIEAVGLRGQLKTEFGIEITEHEDEAMQRLLQQQRRPQLGPEHPAYVEAEVQSATSEPDQ